MKLFFYKDSNDKTRGHSFKLRSIIPRLDTRKNFFGCRIVSIWNQLSRKTVEAQSADSFKNLLKTEDLSLFTLNNHDALFFSKSLDYASGKL